MKFEHWFFIAPLRLRSTLRRGKMERELDEELRFHLDHKIEEGIANGLTPKEARLAALRAMDGLNRTYKRIRPFFDYMSDMLAPGSIRHSAV